MLVSQKIAPVMEAYFKGLLSVSMESAWLKVLSLAVVSSIGVVFAWWGLRKVSKIIMGAFRNGSLKF